jgi:hypothetical protein
MNLKEKIEFVIKKYGYESDYAFDMMKAIETNEENKNFHLIRHDTVVLKGVGYFEAEYTLQHLIGEYELLSNDEFKHLIDDEL